MLDRRKEQWRISRFRYVPRYSCADERSLQPIASTPQPCLRRIGCASTNCAPRKPPTLLRAAPPIPSSIPGVAPELRSKKSEAVQATRFLPGERGFFVLRRPGIRWIRSESRGPQGNQGSNTSAAGRFRTSRNQRRGGAGWFCREILHCGMLSFLSICFYGEKFPGIFFAYYGSQQK